MGEGSVQVPPPTPALPPSATLTQCVGFVVFRAVSCPEAHSGWRYGCVTATPTPDTTEGAFGLVIGLWRSNECRAANGLQIRAGRWGRPSSPRAPRRMRPDAAVCFRSVPAPLAPVAPLGGSDGRRLGAPFASFCRAILLAPHDRHPLVRWPEVCHVACRTGQANGSPESSSRRKGGAGSSQFGADLPEGRGVLVEQGKWSSRDCL
jgi:hypothetical protein